MNRALRRAAPVALVSAAALLLAGCAGSTSPEASKTPTAEAAECMDLSSGDLSDGVTVEGDFGTSPTATFTTPLEADELERTVVIEGDGETTKKGDKVNVVVTAYSGTTGEQAFSDQASIAVGSPMLEGFAAGFDCVAVGSRTVTVAPAATVYGEDGNESVGIAPGDNLVIVMDVVEIAKPLKPSSWTENVPEVKFAAEGEMPTVTLPATPPPTELQLKVLEEGDGDVVEEGDSVTVQYLGTSWETGDVFDSSYERGEAATFTTDGVIPGFGAALVGQKVGTKLIVTIPPQYAYGTEPASEQSPLSGQTLVFLVEIQDTAPATDAK